MYLEALHMKTWQQGFTTLGFTDWMHFNGIKDMLNEKRMLLSYPKRWTVMMIEDSRKAMFYKHKWEQDFLKEAIGFEP